MAVDSGLVCAPISHRVPGRATAAGSAAALPAAAPGRATAAGSAAGAAAAAAGSAEAAAAADADSGQPEHLATGRIVTNTIITDIAANDTHQVWRKVFSSTTALHGHAPAFLHACLQSW